MLPADLRTAEIALLKAALARKDREEAPPGTPNWRDVARFEQLRPQDCFIWLFLGGRGSGKTRAAAERVKERIESGHASRIALIGRDAAAARDVMCEGPSGLHTIARHLVHRYNRSLGEIVFKNRSVAKCFSSEQPDALRGPQHTDVWIDELCAFSYPEETLRNALAGLRMRAPECTITTTPRPMQVMADLIKRPGIRITRSSMMANAANLAPETVRELQARYAGTKWGAQELEGQMIEEAEGALFQREWIESNRTDKPVVLPNARAEGPIPDPDFVGQAQLKRELEEWGEINPFDKAQINLVRVVVGIDPSVAGNEKGRDECGIVVAGTDDNGDAYILDDLSGNYSPLAWARKAVEALETYNAEKIVAERNNGGELVRTVINSIASRVKVQPVWAATGKRARAEPVASLYENALVHHCKRLAQLEDEMCTWDATKPGAPSPNRIDALVWTLYGLDLGQKQLIRIQSRLAH